jgi:hypothetical protein
MKINVVNPSKIINIISIAFNYRIHLKVGFWHVSNFIANYDEWLQKLFQKSSNLHKLWFIDCQKWKQKLFFLSNCLIAKNL